jgi:hypothetical protein
LINFNKNNKFFSGGNWLITTSFIDVNVFCNIIPVILYLIAYLEAAYIDTAPPILYPKMYNFSFLCVDISIAFCKIAYASIYNPFCDGVP